MFLPVFVFHRKQFVPEQIHDLREWQFLLEVYLLQEPIPIYISFFIRCKRFSKQLSVGILFQFPIAESSIDGLIQAVVIYLVCDKQLIAVEEIFHSAVKHISIKHRMELFCYYRLYGVGLKVDRRYIREQKWVVKVHRIRSDNIAKAYIDRHLLNDTVHVGSEMKPCTRIFLVNSYRLHL